jgi:hypothetical protein
MSFIVVIVLSSPLDGRIGDPQLEAIGNAASPAIVWCVRCNKAISFLLGSLNCLVLDLASLTLLPDFELVMLPSQMSFSFFQFIFYL